MGIFFKKSAQFLNPREQKLVQLQFEFGYVQKPRPKIDLRLDPTDNVGNLLRWFGETDNENLQLHNQFHQLAIRENIEGLTDFLNRYRDKLSEIHQHLPELIEQVIATIIKRKSWIRPFVGS